MRMVPSEVVVLLCGLLLSLCISGSAQSEERNHRIADEALREERGAGELDASADVSPQVDREPRRNLFTEFDVNEAALREGRLTAIRGDTATTVNVDSLEAVMRPGTILTEAVRMRAQRSAVPPSLSETGVEAQTYALSFDVLTREGRFRTWGRDSTGLSLDGSSGEFIGRFDVALTDSEDPYNASALGSPVPIAITAPRANRITPRPLTIRRLTEWHSVEIAVRHVPDDEYVVSVSAGPADPADHIEMTVARPRISLAANPPGAITGWGIGKTTVAVQAEGIGNPEGYPVTLQSSRGTLDPVIVKLDAQGRGESTLRSTRHSGAQVTVQGTNLRLSRPLTVNFDAPWLYFGLAMLGGFLGAILRGTGREHWIKALLIGALSGVLMALCYALGVDWFARLYPNASVARGGEALVFVLGAIGAFVGVEFLLRGRVPSGARKSAR